MTTLERYRECGKPADVNVLGESAREMLTKLRVRLDPSKFYAASVREEMRLLFVELDRTAGTATIDECPFAGDVEVLAHGQLGGQVLLTWTCPTCNHNHEETD